MMNLYNPQFYKAQIHFGDQFMRKDMAGSAYNDKRRGFQRRSVPAHEDFCGIKTALTEKNATAWNSLGCRTCVYGIAQSQDR